MKKEHMEFNARVNAIVTDASTRSKIVSVAIALAASNLCALPTSPVENPSNFYNMQTSAQIRHTLSYFNENIIFDVKAAMDYARSFWMIRYTAAHPLSRPIYSLNSNFFESIFGVGTFMHPDVISLVSKIENKDAVLILSTMAGEIAVTMQKDQDGDY